MNLIIVTCDKLKLLLHWSELAVVILACT